MLVVPVTRNYNQNDVVGTISLSPDWVCDLDWSKHSIGLSTMRRADGTELLVAATVLAEPDLNAALAKAVASPEPVDVSSAEPGTVGWLIDRLLQLPMDLSVCRYDSEYGNSVVSAVTIEHSSSELVRYVQVR